MKILFLGGTGNISQSCSREALKRGWELYHLNRGRTKSEPDLSGVPTFTCDANDKEAVKKALAGMRFDVVVQWIAFTPDQVERDIELYKDITAQYIFISSASAYHKPVRHYMITESTPLFNPFWEYSRQKIACENVLFKAYRESGFPVTVVRPSHTYGESMIPTVFMGGGPTICHRIRDGKPIVVHGGGQSLWTLTHSDDFAKGFSGLLGQHQALGEVFHITSDEALTWDNIHLTIAHALGREAKIVHVPAELIAVIDPETGDGILGDKAYSILFDNTKIKRMVPGFECTVTFNQGIRRSLAWLEAHPERNVINPAIDRLIDQIIIRYQTLLA